jgi:hypothetical protein
MIPNLFIVGAPKCGTTAWYEYLKGHPDIFFSEEKEPHYFATDLPGFRTVETERDYLALYAGAAEPVLGDASVFHLCSGAAAERIAAFNPEARILIFLRPQEDLLPALHQQFLYTLDEDIADFGTAWRLSGNRRASEIPSTCRESALLDYRAMGRFDEQVERYFSRFPADRIRVIGFKEWTSNPRSTYLGILQFLGIRDDGRMSFPRVNEAKFNKSPLLAQVSHRPPEWMRAVIALLHRISGRDTLGIGARVIAMNRQMGYRAALDPALRDEIIDCYREPNRRLAARVGSVLSATEPSGESTADGEKQEPS